MRAAAALLARLARAGRWVLLAGLAAGIALPGLAAAMAPAIVPLIATMLFLALLRMGPEGAAGPRGALGRAGWLALALQGALPLAAGAGLAAVGLAGTPAGIGAVLVLAAAPITGTPGLAILCGVDPGPALRQLLVGTALLPLTALPVFALLPVFPDPWAVGAAALRLLGVVAGAALAAWALRAALPALGRAGARGALDGLMALAMGLVVIALMSAVGPALRAGDPALVGCLALAFALNLLPALGVWHALAGRLGRGEATALAVAAGNRNLALFLAALPPGEVERLLLFVGCYQVPMYLTPLVLPRLIGRRGRG